MWEELQGQNKLIRISYESEGSWSTEEEYQQNDYANDLIWLPVNSPGLTEQATFAATAN